MSAIDLIRAYALRRGKFTLASGKESDVLVDLSVFLRTVRGQEAVRDNIPAPLLEERFMFTTAGGPSVGAELVCSALTARPLLFIPRWFGVRKEEKGRGLDRGFITGALEKPDRVLLVDDVMTTGASALRAAEVIKDFGATIVAAFCVVDRGGLAEVVDQLRVPGYSMFHIDDLLNEDDS